MIVPLPGAGAAVTSPPWALASWRTMYKPRPIPPNRLLSPASPWTKRSNTRSASSREIPIPSSRTVTSIEPSGSTARAAIVTVPPSGEYLNAFSSNWPTMLSVAPASPYASGRSSGTSLTNMCRSESGRNTVAASVSSLARSNGSLRTASRLAPARDPSRSWSTSLASDSARSAIVVTAACRSVSASLSHRLASVLANPWTTVIGVRSSWLVVAKNRSLASSSSLAAVTSRKSITCSSRPSSTVQRTSIQRPLDSRQVSVAPGSGSGNDGGLPAACAAETPVSACADGFHCLTKPALSSTAMPSALLSITARSCARWRTTSAKAVAFDSATLAWPASSSSSSRSTWPTLRLLYSAYSAPYGLPAT